MDTYTYALGVAAASILPVAGGLGLARYIAYAAKRRAEAYEQEMEDWIDRRCREADDFVAATMRRWSGLGRLSAEQITTAVDERDTLEEMVDELRTERDLLSTENAALKVDAVEHERVANTFARQAMRADQVIALLTNHLSAAGIPTDLDALHDAHIESLMRSEMSVRAFNRGPASIGRASDLERLAA